MACCSDSKGVIYLPALIDCHVHFREPGFVHKGDMLSEGSAALAGGISVACDMPNTFPPTQTIHELSRKVERASASGCPIRLFFFFGATEKSHLAELEALWTQSAHETLKAHCCGLKLYLDNSTGDLKSSDDVTEAAFELCGRLDIPLVAHCEHSATNDSKGKEIPYSGPASHSLRRPPESEQRSIAQAIRLAVQHHTPLHIAHLSTQEGLEAIRQSRRDHAGLRLSCEVTPHHLFLSTEDYSCCGSRAKVNPPVRDVHHAERLWEGVLDGTIDCIATDHAPHTLREKEDVSEEQQPPSGMPGVELVVPLLLTVVAGSWPHPNAPIPATLMQTRKLTVKRVQEMLHDNPNKIFRLGVGKEKVKNIAFDVEQEWVVEEAALHSKCGWTPYKGWKLKGKVICK